MRVFFLIILYFLLQTPAVLAAQNTCASDTSKYECVGSVCEIKACLPNQLCGYEYGSSSKVPTCFTPNAKSLTLECGSNGTQNYLWKKEERIFPGQRIKPEPQIYYQEKKCPTNKPICEMQGKQAVCTSTPVDVNAIELCIDSGPITNVTKINEYKNNPVMYKIPDPSILEGGRVKKYKGGQLTDTIPDQCKAGTDILVEQACMNGKLTTAAVDCKQVGGAAAKCSLNQQNEAYCKIKPEISKDTDKDGVFDIGDNCINTKNTDQLDKDQDGLGDACDNCAYKTNADQLNSDGDPWGDVCDTCPMVVTPTQSDSDNDGKGNECDNCIFNFNPLQENTTLGPLGDACEEIEAVLLKTWSDHSCALTPEGRIACWGELKGPSFEFDLAMPHYFNPSMRYLQFEGNYYMGCARNTKDQALFWQRHSESPVFGGNPIGDVDIYEEPEGILKVDCWAGDKIAPTHPKLSKYYKSVFTENDHAIECYLTGNKIMSDHKLKCKNFNPAYLKTTSEIFNEVNMDLILKNSPLDLTKPYTIYDFDLSDKMTVLIWGKNLKGTFVQLAVTFGITASLDPPIVGALYYINSDIPHNVVFSNDVPSPSFTLGAYEVHTNKNINCHHRGNIYDCKGLQPDSDDIIDDLYFVMASGTRVDAQLNRFCYIYKFPSYYECVTHQPVAFSSTPLDSYGMVFEDKEVPQKEYRFISAATQHECGIDVLGQVFCWGENSSGQCGIDQQSQDFPFNQPNSVPLHEYIDALPSPY